MTSGGEASKITEKIDAYSFCLICKRGDIGLVQGLVNEGLDLKIINEGLIYASIKGNKDIVKFLINSGANVNSTDDKGNTALFYACEKGYKSIVKVLIDNGANVNIKNNNNETPIMKACYNNHKNIVYFLLNKVSNIDFRNIKILTWACGNGHIKIVKKLIKKNVNINESYSNKDVVLPMVYTRNIPKPIRFLLENYTNRKIYNEEKWVSLEGDTPLLAACMVGYTDIVAILLKKGANANISNKNHNTPLLLACIGGHKKIVELLLKKGAKTDVINKSGWVPLICASYKRQKNIVKLLLDKNADVDIVDSNGNTALMFACDKSDNELVKLLLRYGADINMADAEGQTALMRACMDSNENIVSMLLNAKHNNRKIDINAKDELGRTALMYACDDGSIEVVRSLLKALAKVDIEDSYGYTALMWAISAGNIHIAKLLLKNFADINNLSKTFGIRQKTFLMRVCEFDESGKIVNWLLSEYCKKNGKEAVINLINTGDNQGMTALMIAADAKFVELIKVLLQNGSNLHQKDLSGNTALHVASNRGGLIDVIRLLLDAGAIIDEENLNGNTPLHFACGSNLVETIDFLIDNGANIRKVDEVGNSVLHISCIYNSIDAVRALIKKDVDINLKNTEGKTPLIIACEEGDEEITKVLLKANADVNVSDKLNNSPLGIAFEKSNIKIGQLLVANFAYIDVLGEEENIQRDNYIKKLKLSFDFRVKVRIALYQKDFDELRTQLNGYFNYVNVKRREGEEIGRYIYRMLPYLDKIDDMSKFMYRLSLSKDMNKLKISNKKIQSEMDLVKMDPFIGLRCKYEELSLNEKLINLIELFKDISGKLYAGNVIYIVICSDNERKAKAKISSNKKLIEEILNKRLPRKEDVFEGVNNLSHNVINNHGIYSKGL